MFNGLFQKKRKIQELRAPSLQEIKRFREIYAKAAEARQVEIPVGFERSIYKAISGQKEICSLDFRDADITDPQVIALAEALLEMPLVASLDLRDNRITDEGVKAILEVLRVQVVAAKASSTAACGASGTASSSSGAKSLPSFARLLTRVKLKGNEISSSSFAQVDQYVELLTKEDVKLEIRLALQQIDFYQKLWFAQLDPEQVKLVMKMLSGSEPTKKELAKFMFQLEQQLLAQQASASTSTSFNSSQKIPLDATLMESLLFVKFASLAGNGNQEKSFNTSNINSFSSNSSHHHHHNNNTTTTKPLPLSWENIVQIRHANIGNGTSLRSIANVIIQAQQQQNQQPPSPGLASVVMAAMNASPSTKQPQSASPDNSSQVQIPFENKTRTLETKSSAPSVFQAVVNQNLMTEMKARTCDLKTSTTGSAPPLFVATQAPMVGVVDIKPRAMEPKPSMNASSVPATGGLASNASGSVEIKPRGIEPKPSMSISVQSQSNQQAVATASLIDKQQQTVRGSERDDIPAPRSNSMKRMDAIDMFSPVKTATNGELSAASNSITKRHVSYTPQKDATGVNASTMSAASFQEEQITTAILNAGTIGRNNEKPISIGQRASGDFSLKDFARNATKYPLRKDSTEEQQEDQVEIDDHDLEIGSSATSPAASSSSPTARLFANLNTGTIPLASANALIPIVSPPNNRDVDPSELTSTSEVYDMTDERDEMWRTESQYSNEETTIESPNESRVASVIDDQPQDDTWETALREAKMAAALKTSSTMVSQRRTLDDLAADSLDDIVTSQEEDEMEPVIEKESNVVDVRIDGTDREIAMLVHSEFQRKQMALEEAFPEINFRNLVALVLSGNELTSLQLFRQMRWPALKVLDLSQNKLAAIDEAELAGFKKLLVLDLSENQLKNIDGLTHVFNLRALNLASNGIRLIKNLEHLEKLEILKLSNNCISSVQALRPLSLNKALYHLDLDENTLVTDKKCRRHLVQLMNMVPQLVTIGSLKSTSLMIKEKRRSTLQKSCSAPANISTTTGSMVGALRSPSCSSAVSSMVPEPPEPPAGSQRKSLYDELELVKSRWISAACDGLQITQDPEILLSPRSKTNRKEQRMHDELRSKAPSFKTRAKASPMKPPPVPVPPPVQRKKKKPANPELAAHQQRKDSILATSKHPPIDKRLFHAVQRRKSRQSFEVCMTVGERMDLTNDIAAGRRSSGVLNIPLLNSFAEVYGMDRRKSSKISELLANMRSMSVASLPSTASGVAASAAIASITSSSLKGSSPPESDLAAALGASPRQPSPRSAPFKPFLGASMEPIRESDESEDKANSPLRQTKSSEEGASQAEVAATGSPADFMQELAIEEFLFHAKEEISTALTALNVLVVMSEKGASDANKIEEYRRSLNALNILDDRESTALFSKIAHPDAKCQTEFDKLVMIKKRLRELLERLQLHSPGSMAIQDFCVQMLPKELKSLLDSSASTSSAAAALVAMPATATATLTHLPQRASPPKADAVAGTSKQSSEELVTEDELELDLNDSSPKSVNQKLFASPKRSGPDSNEEEDSFDFDKTSLDIEAALKAAASASTSSSAAAVDVSSSSASSSNVPAPILAEEPIKKEPMSVAVKSDMDMFLGDITEDIQLGHQEDTDDEGFGDTNVSDLMDTLKQDKQQQQTHHHHQQQQQQPSPKPAPAAQTIQPSPTQPKDPIATSKTLPAEPAALPVVTTPSALRNAPIAEQNPATEAVKEAEEHIIKEDEEEQQQQQEQSPANEGEEVQQQQQEAEEEETEEAEGEDDQTEIFGNWEKGFDPNTNHFFWFNHETEESSWTPPEGWPYPLDDEDGEEEEEEEGEEEAANESYENEEEAAEAASAVAVVSQPPQQLQQQQPVQDLALSDDELSLEQRIAQALQGSSQRQLSSSSSSSSRTGSSQLQPLSVQIPQAFASSTASTTTAAKNAVDDDELFSDDIELPF